MATKSEQNLISYDGVEDLKAFASKAAIEKYREERKAFVKEAVGFIKKRLKNKKNNSAVDIGSGSSCLLYALYDEGIISQGVGVEIAKTRFNFAEKWKKDKGYSAIENLNKDIRKITFKNDSFDVCTILDSTFTYFYPVDKNMPAKVLRNVYNGLKKGGCCILELLDFFEVKKLCKTVGVYYKWVELPKTNKFRYAMYKIEYFPKTEEMCTETRYLYRDKKNETKKIEYSKVYNVSEFKKMLKEIGFKKISFYDGYNDTRYNPKTSNKMVLTCYKEE